MSYARALLFSSLDQRCGTHENMFDKEGDDVHKFYFVPASLTKSQPLLDDALMYHAFEMEVEIANILSPAGHVEFAWDVLTDDTRVPHVFYSSYQIVQQSTEAKR